MNSDQVRQMAMLVLGIVPQRMYENDAVLVRGLGIPVKIRPCLEQIRTLTPSAV